MGTSAKYAIFYMRRDLRLDDNRALQIAAEHGLPVQPVFIFDTEILSQLTNPHDARVSFIHKTLQIMNRTVNHMGCEILFFHGNPVHIFEALAQDPNLKAVFASRDYEPYATERDNKIKRILEQNQIAFTTIDDQVIFAPEEVLKDDGNPYSVFTPYSRKWLKKFHSRTHLATSGSFKDVSHVLRKKESHDNYPDAARQMLFENIPSLSQLGFKESAISVPAPLEDPEKLARYHETRDIPAFETTNWGPHLRFGTISVRKAAGMALETSEVLFKELIWREFFMQQIFHYPQLPIKPLKPAYEKIPWRQNEEELQRFLNAETGFDIIDAGIRQLLKSGTMHNRVRMIVASFFTRHLLFDWRIGERFFARHLLDFELSSNAGNWQWAAGCGSDAVPYFRIFNPVTQQKKFDKDRLYINQWLTETFMNRPPPMVDLKFTRERALGIYKKFL